MSAVADNYAKLQELGIEVLSVSVDSHFVHKMWNDHELSKMVEGGVPFPMVSDQAGNVGRAYGVWDEAQGIELRGRFIIDPDGRDLRDRLSAERRTGPDRRDRAPVR